MHYYYLYIIHYGYNKQQMVNNMKSKIRVVFEYDHIEVEWNGRSTFNLYFIDSIGCRDHQAFDCFTNYNAKNIKQAQFASDQYIKEMHKEVA